VADLSPITALGESAPRTSSFGLLTLAEDDTLALVTLARLGGAVLPDLGIAMPGPMELVQGPDLWALWIAPDQWLTGWPGRSAQDMAAILSRRAAGCAVTDQTDGFVGIHLTGPDAMIAAALEKLVNLDPACLSPGHGTRITLHHQSVFALRPSAQHLSLLGPRSGAADLWRHLETVAARLGGTP
jgi:heterotetrameric sarcosine oxidase gamma subunit